MADPPQLPPSLAARTAHNRAPWNNSMTEPCFIMLMEFPELICKIGLCGDKGLSNPVTDAPTEGPPEHWPTHSKTRIRLLKLAACGICESQKILKVLRV